MWWHVERLIQEIDWEPEQWRAHTGNRRNHDQALVRRRLPPQPIGEKHERREQGKVANGDDVEGDCKLVMLVKIAP
jgi:hypothetical protein